MRMSAIRHETWFRRLDFSRLVAPANAAAEKPADSSRSLVVSRIDSQSSTIATSGALGTPISRWQKRETSAREPCETIPRAGAASEHANISEDKGMEELPLWCRSPTALR